MTTRRPARRPKPRQPAWIRCPDCDDFFCTIHMKHTADCPCPPIDEWKTDPYGLQRAGPAAKRSHAR